MTMKISWVLFFVTLMASTASAQSKLDSALPAIKGTGASSMAALYSAWAQDYSKGSPISLTYSGTSSGEGIRAIKANEVVFGATDDPLPPEELKNWSIIQIPMVVLGIVPVVNLPKMDANKLHLDENTLSEIFLNRIKNWNDPRIAALNPRLALPSLPITRVVSSAASGTMGTFTQYLSLVNQEWKPLAGLQPRWPGQVVLAKGTDAMVASIQSNPGAIGIVSYDRVQTKELSSVILRNANGQFVSANPESLLAAVKHSGVKTNLNATLLNVKGEGAWPLTTLTYVLMKHSADASGMTHEAVKFFSWALRQGDSEIMKAGFIPLPSNVQTSAFSTLMRIKSANGERPALQ